MHQKERKKKKHNLKQYKTDKFNPHSLKAISLSRKPELQPCNTNKYYQRNLSKEKQKGNTYNPYTSELVNRSVWQCTCHKTCRLVQAHLSQYNSQLLPHTPQLHLSLLPFFLKCLKPLNGTLWLPCICLASVMMPLY